ncbi:MAG: hypothetical protein ACREQ4_01810 [Candidatus Binataceae bacterium]
MTRGLRWPSWRSAGWDTHVSEGNEREPLGEGLTGFANALGPAYGDTESW